jgi:putative transposase
VSHTLEAHGLSEQHACWVVKQPRGTQRYRPTQRDDEDTLTQAIVTLASQYGRYGYRRITALLKRTGWQGSGGADLAS